jgi:hypothetical protein
MTAAAVSPVVPWLLAFTLERRWLRLREQYLAFAIGDCVLAFAVTAGEWADGSHLHQALSLGGVDLRGAVWALGLLGGILQWHHEIRTGVYTRSQALSPTKVWHQLFTIPLLSVWVTLALFATATHALDHPLAACIAFADVLIWWALVRYDAHHTKLGHAPYDWRRLRPPFRPWLADSTTLRRAGTDQRAT